MSGFFDSFVSSLNSSRSRSDSIEMANCYNLYVHHNETIDIDDDITDPPAFQIPSHMKWRDIHGLVVGEIGCGEDTQFSYMDDENDEVRINSQEEYETALHICRKEHRDLHIYNIQSPGTNKGFRRKKFKHKESQETKKERPTPPLQPDEDHTNITESRENEDRQRTNLGLPKAQTPEPPQEGAVGGGFVQMDEVTSSIPAEDKRETKPFPPSNSLISLIRKEASRIVSAEVNDLWAFVNVLKRDINAELDDMQDRLASQRSQTPEEETQNEEHLKTAESPPSSISTASSQDGSEEVEYAASFICENLPDDSVITCGQKFEKYWVFKNEGNVEWDEETRLHLLDESCDPSAATGSSLSEWGATMKSIPVPSLKEGETGVICANHVAPAHPCNYQSSWKLSHKNNPFGPRVWCNICVEQESGSERESGSPVDQGSKSLESFVDLAAVEPETEEPKKTENASEEVQSVIPPLKVQNDEATKAAEEQEPHPNLNVMSFDMGDISDGAKYIDTANEEIPHFNPAVSSVKREDTEEECLHLREEGVGASVDSEASHSVSSESPVMVSPPSEAEADVNEEQKPLETDQEKDGEEAKEEEQDDAKEEEEDEDVENFTEQTVEPRSFSSDEESDAGEEEQEGSQEEVLPRSNSEDLQSVDFALEEEPASMASFASGFVVVPLPDCFDVNKPLNGSQYLEKDEDTSDSESKDEEPKSDDHEADPNYPPDESDSEPESQPASVTLAAEYRSEDSLGTTSLKAVNSPQISLPPPTEGDAPPSGGVTPQPESVDNESLTERIHKEFDEFLANPEHPVEPPAPSKIPMNQMPTSSPKVILYAPDPKPVPSSVTNIDTPYEIPNSQTTPSFPPFEQGWRRNPIAVAPSVISDDPWPETRPTPAPRSPLQLPTPQSAPNPAPVEMTSALPSVPFAVASPSESLHDDGQGFARLQRPPSPQIAIADDFYPIGVAVPGSNVDPDPEEYDLFRTPPPSPPIIHRGEIESGPLDQLYEMGFHDIELNKNIFDSCERDLSRTVQALVLRAEADQRYNETA